MNTGTMILSAFFIAICALPFILSSRGSRKRKNTLLKSLQTLANKHDAQISNYDVGADFIIGMDNIKNLVFFFKKTADNSVENCVDLSDYKDCKILKFGKDLHAKSSSYAIERLKLDFIPKDKSVPEQQFEFYNEAVNTQLSGEIQIINTWHELIEKKLALN
ncbi:conserved hypothetical protein [Formosa agariphila KMM 3901]|uniref:Uncharacterized protein n=1 Tax=Formosa agariphila (strain DSM 15362 / KCTC 12365 / LMG 23005 / KMM 3901 / M-2Alg 35-1) TaxID=1347342 RepID=T2KKG0_FORAG|nr:hypothetical protein [Formosa agariphila]CDF78901.1 conserved hypothetical protein [Formosa agariphila KMM 3901]